ncbi:hypothetical protein Y032_0398g733 [Ancylostoma ceylanicum]|uniref:Uncharacterized protein n=1 Tax=Ancylostoma ceylanicum TaxID=53326 RepID=A0A016RSB8_9BILA|nr:hypothetical protein Y032_0398g733 [Ancylostoma ceylanicum]
MRLVMFVGYRSNSKSLPHALVANAFKLCNATNPPQHSHLYDANSALHFLGNRPTFATIKRDRTYHGSVDLRLEAVWEFLSHSTQQAPL